MLLSVHIVRKLAASRGYDVEVLFRTKTGLRRVRLVDRMTGASAERGPGLEDFTLIAAHAFLERLPERDGAGGRALDEAAPASDRAAGPKPRPRPAATPTEGAPEERAAVPSPPKAGPLPAQRSGRGKARDRTQTELLPPVAGGRGSGGGDAGAGRRRR